MASSCKLFYRDANEKLDCGNIGRASVIILLISLVEEEEVSADLSSYQVKSPH